MNSRSLDRERLVRGVASFEQITARQVGVLLLAETHDGLKGPVGRCRLYLVLPASHVCA